MDVVCLEPFARSSAACIPWIVGNRFAAISRSTSSNMAFIVSARTGGPSNYLVMALAQITSIRLDIAAVVKAK